MDDESSSLSNYFMKNTYSNSSCAQEVRKIRVETINKNSEPKGISLNKNLRTLQHHSMEWDFPIFNGSYVNSLYVTKVCKIPKWSVTSEFYFVPYQKTVQKGFSRFPRTITELKWSVEEVNTLSEPVKKSGGLDLPITRSGATKSRKSTSWLSKRMKSEAKYIAKEDWTSVSIVVL